MDFALQIIDVYHSSARCCELYALHKIKFYVETILSHYIRKRTSPYKQTTGATWNPIIHGLGLYSYKQNHYWLPGISSEVRQNVFF